MSREPHKAKQRYANPDVRASMRDAFRAAERQLRTHKEQLREDTTPPSGSALAGQVTRLPPGADHGFILNNLGTQLYFHRDSVTNAELAALKEGDLVHYVEEEGDAGPVAIKVKVPSGQQG